MEEKKLSKDNEKKESLKKLEEIEKAYFDLMKAYSSCLAPLYLKQYYICAVDLMIIYSFTWDNVPGTDSEILLMFLKDYLHIDWAENAEIHKSTDGKTIRIFKDENSAKITIDEKKEKATLKINDGRIHDLKVKKEHGKLNISPKIKRGAWLGLEGFYRERLSDLTKQPGNTGNIGPYKIGSQIKNLGFYIDLMILPANIWKIQPGNIWYIKLNKISSQIKNFIAYRIVRLKIRKRLDWLRDVFLLLIIAQNRNKIDSEIIKNFEIFSEDLAKLSAQFGKYSFYAIISVVVPLLTGVFLSGFRRFDISEDIMDVISLIGGALVIISIVIFIFILIGFFLGSRLFNSAAIPEKENKIYVLIQEYLEFK